jgi:predicted RNA binding protein YcfA (HicA-like mRNA interferase family)
MSDVKKVIKKAEQAGWRVRQNANGHVVFYSPDGKTLVVGNGLHKASDRRAFANMCGDLRKAGLVI